MSGRRVFSSDSPTEANPLLCRMAAADRLRAMTSRIDLTIDKQGRMSVGRLGLTEGHAVAEPLPDGSGWVLRPARLVTEAEVDILSRRSNVEAVERSLRDLAEGRTRTGYRRRPKG